MLMQAVKEMLSEASGQLSSMRVMVFMSVTNIMVVWTVKNMTEHAWVSMDVETISLLGVLLGAKAVQRVTEK